MKRNASAARKSATGLMVNFIVRQALSTPFLKYIYVFRGNRSLTVAALNGGARVSKRYWDTLANF